MGLKKGQTNNRNGRPPAGNSFVEQLRQAILDVEKEQGKSLMRHAVERAFKEDMVLNALMKKLIPDLTETDVNLKTYEHFKKLKQDYGFGS